MSIARIRVSCAALCRIQDDAGRYLLGLNKNRLSQGREIYMPLGGALEFTAPDLLARFEATSEAPGSRDLRLFMPAARVPDFRAWFLARQERETSPLRELVEELVGEFAVLDALTADDVDIRLARTYEGEAASGRRGVAGTWTHYLHEVFQIDITNPPVLATLLAVPPASGLRWLSPHEIANHRTDDGIAIYGGALVDVIA
jgi:hypothetical protein